MRSILFLFVLTIIALSFGRTQPIFIEQDSSIAGLYEEENPDPHFGQNFPRSKNEQDSTVQNDERVNTKMQQFDAARDVGENTYWLEVQPREVKEGNALVEDDSFKEKAKYDANFNRRAIMEEMGMQDAMMDKRIRSGMAGMLLSDEEEDTKEGDSTVDKAVISGGKPYKRAMSDVIVHEERASNSDKEALLDALKREIQKRIFSGRFWKTKFEKEKVQKLKPYKQRAGLWGR